MMREIERMDRILNDLRLLANNIGHESDIDAFRLRKGIKYLTEFYQEMGAEYERQQLEKGKESEETSQE